MQDRDGPHESDDPTSSAAGGVGDGMESGAKGAHPDPRSNVETSIPEAVRCNIVEVHFPNQVGELSMTHTHECVDETLAAAIVGVPLVPVEPLQISALSVAEQSSGSCSNSISKSQQGGKVIGRQKGRKLRKGGSVKVQEIRSSPSQSVTPYDIFADQSSEENQENRSSTKQTKRTPTGANDPSVARKQSHRGDGECFNGTPSRRLAFAPVPPSELNRRMGTTLNQTPEKFTPTKTVETSNSFTPIQVASTSVDEDLASPILSLQQAGYLTSQALTLGDESDLESVYVDEDISVTAITHYNEEETIESALERQSAQLYGPSDSSEHHDSDKENVPVREEIVTWKFPQRFNSPGSFIREPLQTLYSAPSPSMYQSPDIFTTPTTSQRLVRARFQVDAGRQWRMVVDTNSLLNTKSLDSLKLLEGIRETRLVIPNIVVRELDYLQKQDSWKAPASSTLQWIEACMLKMPSWIHVQSSGETVHVAMTPPVSPSLYRGLTSHVDENDMMHPTLHDHVLECALFQQTMPDGRVAILTDDTTLKIKALAESLVVDTAINFSDSLLNPYSNRFVYAGSTPIERLAVSRLPENLYVGFSTPGTAISNPKWRTPDVGPVSRPDTPRPTSRSNFCQWRNSQPLGLQVLLQSLESDLS